ncbi:MAG: hypothetical protein GEU79_01365 [Acidimicrobiia bacterium]|nr:hypothetical protein [Acidimicrobiia bacterium]
MDDRARALGCDSRVSKSTVSRICQGIDTSVEVCRTRPLDHLASLRVLGRHQCQGQRGSCIVSRRW